MARAAACPTAEDLRQLALGLLPDPVAAECAAHVESCPACLAVLRQVAVSDPLLEAVAGLGRSRAAGTTPELQAVIARLSTPAGHSAATSSDTPADSHPAASSPAHDATLARSLPPAPAADVPAALAGHPRYRVVGLLGKGGMGAVYKAEHRLMQRTVALKVVGRHLLEKPAAVERFLLEVKAAARLAHPNIVTAHDAEQAGDVHFLVMEYVEGTSLADVLAERGPLPVGEACSYVRQAALGLQHAFEQGMVHRDIKPHNLMLTPQRRVKILDFGLARFVSENAPGEGLTAPGIAMGTPDYIAPEQASDSHRADIRADLYSLGCTLYHLLTGRVPFPTGTPFQKMVAHQQRPPAPAAELRRDLPPGLVAVLDRLLAKDPAGRYQTPADVAAALAPFSTVAGATEPLEAASPARRRARRWSVVVGLAAAAVLLAGAAAVFTYVTDKGTLLVETLDNDVKVSVRDGDRVVIKDLKTHEKYALRPGTYEIVPDESTPGLKVEPGGRFTISRGEQVIVRARWERPAAMPGAAAAVKPPEKPGPVELVEVQHFPSHNVQTSQAVFSPDGKWVLSGANDGTARLWDVAGGEQVRRFGDLPEQVRVVAFLPDGRHALAGGGTPKEGGKKWEDGAIRLLKLDDGTIVRSLTGHTQTVFGLAVAPDGRRAASCALDKSLRLWDVEAGKQVWAVEAQDSIFFSVAFSPDGKEVLAGNWTGDLQLFDAATGQQVRRFVGHKAPVVNVAFSADGRQALSGSLDKTMRLWDVAAGKELRSFEHPTGVTSVAFSPGGQLAASGSGAVWEFPRGWFPAGTDDHVRLWNLASGEEVARQVGGRPVRVVPSVTSVAFAPDGRSVLTATSGGMVQIWRVTPKDEAPKTPKP
jgi:WD40 repeat protein/predicted Ser/Thr protein kinase